VFGAYNATDFNSNATSIFCSSPNGPVRNFAGVAPTFATGPVIGCNPDYNVWAIGSRTIWNPVPNLDIGLEVVYTKIEQKHEAANALAGTGVLMNFAGAVVVPPASTTRPRQTCGPASCAGSVTSGHDRLKQDALSETPGASRGFSFVGRGSAFEAPRWNRCRPLVPFGLAPTQRYGLGEPPPLTGGEP
jgi:hypothetical protein